MEVTILLFLVDILVLEYVSTLADKLHIFERSKKVPEKLTQQISVYARDSTILTRQIVKIKTHITKCKPGCFKL